MRADSSEESLSNGSQMYLCCSLCISWMKAGFLVAKQEGEFPTQLIKCLKILRQAFFKNQTLKQMKKGVHYTSHTQSLLLVLTLQAPAREQNCTFFLSFLSSHPYIHLSRYPVHWSICCPSTYWERVRVCTSPKPKISSTVILIFLFSSIRRPLLWLKTLSIEKKDPRCRPGSPELIDGCTVLGNVGEV